VPNSSFYQKSAFVITASINPWGWSPHDLITPQISNFSFYSFTHMYIRCLGHFSSLPPTPLSSRQNLFCPFLQFCWRVDISNNKKDLVFLLV
jgi:hypothetical protein